MHKEVHLRRQEPNSHLPAKVLTNRKSVLASVLKNRNPLGLKDKDLEKKLLSQLLNIETSDRDYSAKVKEFWTDFRVVVPSGGVVLDISTIEEEGEDPKPREIEDYITFLWAENHPLVGKSKEEMLSSHIKLFHIHDPEKEVAKENQNVKNTKDAYREFIKLSEDEEKMDMVVRLLGGENPAAMTTEMKENQLDTLLKQNPNKFLKVATDKDLSIRAEIKQMVDKNILRKQGASFLYMDTTIGDSEAEAVSYFKNDRNSETVLDLKSRLKELS